MLLLFKAHVVQLGDCLILNDSSRKGPTSKIDTAKIWSLNYRVFTALIERVTPALGEIGLDVKELFILAEMDDHPHPADLAAYLHMPKPTVTVYLKRLEGAGLVKREIDAGDLRRHRLQLTPQGRKLMTKGQSLLAADFATRLARLSPAKQAELQTILEQLL